MIKISWASILGQAVAIVALGIATGHPFWSMLAVIGLWVMSLCEAKRCDSEMLKGISDDLKKVWPKESERAAERVAALRKHMKENLK